MRKKKSSLIMRPMQKESKKKKVKAVPNPQHREDFLRLLRAATDQKASGKT